MVTFIAKTVILNEVEVQRINPLKNKYEFLIIFLLFYKTKCAV